jgi:hypothetical protein
LRLSPLGRATDLLSRPGLVDTILRAYPTLAVGDSPLTELDVYGAFWTRIVLASGPTASRSGREQAAVQTARAILLTTPPGPAAEPGAIDALRRDGILAPYSTFAHRDTFATDLYLDFATARLLTTDGLGLLTSAPRPRWALRATRLAIQARLAADGAAALPAIRSELAAVAAAHGKRWSQLTDEAILGHPAAGTILTQLWPTLAAEPPALHELLTTAARLHCPNGAAVATPRGQPAARPNPALDALAPLVDLLVAHDGEVTAVGGDVRTEYSDLLLAFLRGASWHQFPALKGAISWFRAPAASARCGGTRDRAAAVVVGEWWSGLLFAVGRGAGWLFVLGSWRLVGEAPRRAQCRAGWLQAACWYSWMSPPSTSMRSMCCAGRAPAVGSAPVAAR